MISCDYCNSVVSFFDSLIVCWFWIDCSSRWLVGVFGVFIVVILCCVFVKLFAFVYCFGLFELLVCLICLWLCLFTYYVLLFSWWLWFIVNLLILGTCLLVSLVVCLILYLLIACELVFVRGFSLFVFVYLLCCSVALFVSCIAACLFVSRFVFWISAFVCWIWCLLVYWLTLFN